MFTLSVSATGAVPASPDGLAREVNVWLNTDKNGSTGSTTGNEYALAFGDDPADPTPWWDIYRWDGTEWQSVPETSTMRFARQAGGTMSWTFNKADVGGATGFAVYVSTSTFDAGDNLVAREFAPDGGRWVFDLSGPTKTLTTFVTPVIGKPVSVPAKATAGKRLTVSFPVTRTDAGKSAPLAGGTIAGAPTIGGRVIPHTQSFTSGVARISFVVPKTAQGKQLTVKVTIKAPSSRGEDGISIDLATGYMGIVAFRSIGQSATKVASFVVR
jgi:hypothetical protein